LRTSLVFKFFVIITFGLLLPVSQGLFAKDALTSDGSWLSDSIGIPQGITSSDTIIRPDSIGAVSMNGFLPNDTVAAPDTIIDPTQEVPERKRGSAMMLDAKVDYSAKDSIRFSIRRQVVYLYGDAELQYGNIKLNAAFVEIDFRTKELYAVGMPDSLGEIQGNPIFEEGDQNFESKELRYNFQTKKGRTIRVITEEADGFLHGDYVKIMETKVIHVQSGKYTTCDDPNPHFHISFNKAKLLPGDKIITSAPQLTIAGVRTPLILPFGFFPNTKGRQASGILIPSYGETNNRGFYLENGGFYWGISDYIDLSLRGDIYSRGSWATRLGSNYRKRYKYSGSLNLNYAINILGERNLPGYERNRDFRIMWNHSQDPKARPNSVFRANVNAGSSQYNRFNPTTSNDYLSNTFSSNISYSASWAGRYNLSVNARHSQNTITKAVDMSLPEATFSVARFYPLRRKKPTGRLRWYEEITMNYNANASNQIKTVEEEMFTPQMFSDMRNGVQHSIPVSHSFRVLKFFNLSNSVNYNEKWYFQRHEKSWLTNEVDGEPVIIKDRIDGEVITDTLRGFWAVRDFSYSSSLNTRIYGMKQFSRGPVLAIRHVISPNMGFSYRPDFADPFWGIYDTYDNPNFKDPVRYSYYETGLYRPPAAGRSGALNFSVTNNLEMKVRNRKDTVKGERKIALIDNLSMSTSYDIARDSLKLSDIRVSGRTRLFGQFDITYSSTFSPYATDTLGRPIDTYLWETNKKLLQLRNSSWSLNFNYSLNSKTLGGGGSQQEGPPGSAQQRSIPQRGAPPEDRDDEGPPAPGVIDYSVPWNLRFSYSFNYNTNVKRPELIKDRKYLQNLTFSGDMNLTENWRIGFSSGYNFEMKEITYTSLDIYRDLHCWELLINWIPFGFRQSYNLTLRVKSSVLQDLKLNRRTHHLDRAFQ
jgi:hypothetical protein